MKLQSTLAAVTAAACMTVAAVVYADPNNVPSQGPNVGGNQVSGASHGQPNTGDTGGGIAAVSNAEARQIILFGKEPETAGDRLFALEAGCGNMWETKLAQLEQDKGSDPQVKQLAASIQRDHTAAGQKLEPIALKLGVTIPQALSDDKQAKLDLFSKMPPEKVDAIFLSNMKADHLKDVNVYADHVKVIKDPDLRTYATDTLPHLREHTAMILKANETKGMPAETTFQSTGMSMNQ